MNALKRKIAGSQRTACLSMLAGVWLLGGQALAVQPGPDPVDLPATSRAEATLTVVSGDNQKGIPGTFNAEPFDVAVWNAAGTAPLVDAEVTFTVQAGGGLLAINKEATSPSYTLTLKTDQDGTVRAYYQQPFAPGILSQIKAATESRELVLLTKSLAPGDSADSESSKAETSSNEKTKDQGKGTTNEATKQPRAIVPLAAVAASTSAASSAQAAAQSPNGHGPKLVIKTRKGLFSIDTATWTITSSAQ